MAAYTLAQFIAECIARADGSGQLTSISLQLVNSSGTALGSGTADANRGKSAISGLSITRSGSVATIDFTDMTFEDNGTAPSWSATSVNKLRFYVDAADPNEAEQSMDIDIGPFTFSVGAKLTIQSIAITVS